MADPSWYSLNNPALGPSLVLGGGIADYLQAAKLAEQQDAWNRRSFSLGAAVARQGAINQWRDLAIRRDEQRAAARDALDEFTSGVRMQASAARVSGIEGGMTGNTLVAILDQYEAVSAKSELNFLRSQASADAQMMRESEAVAGQLQSTLLSLQRPKATKPNLAGSLFNTAINMYGSYLSYNKAQA